MDKNKNTVQTSGDVFNDDYIPYIARYGKITNWLGVLISFGPPLVLLVIFGLLPPASAVISAFIAIASAVGINWFIEPISYFPIIGVAGTYMAFLTGNISNLRIPCAAVSQKVADVEPGTDEGTIISTLGMAVSVLVNIAILIVGVFAGTYILSVLPASVTSTLNYLLPALFGALFVQFALMKLQIAPIAMAIALILGYMVNSGVFSFLPGMPSYVTTLGTVFGTIAISMTLHKKNII